MVRIRSRQHATVAGRPLEGEHVPPPEELDELAGVEAFGPRGDVDPDDPFGTGTAEGPRRGDPGRSSLATAGLVAAAIVLVIGALSVVLGLADDDDDDGRSDDVATDATTSTTTESLSTSSTTATSAPSTTSTTAGFAPGTTATTVARPTVTTLRPATTLPTTTTLPANRVMTVSVDVVMADDRSSDIVAGDLVDITVRLVDPDAIPSGNCLRVVVEGGLDDDVLADNTCETACPAGTATEPTGGTFENGFSYTFPEDGTYHVVVTATSGRPGCGNPFADRVDDVKSSPITVATAA